MGMQTWSTDLPLLTSCPHRTSKTTPSLIPSSSTSTRRQNSNSEVAGDPSSWQHGINGPQVINLIYRDLANHTTGPAAVQEYNAPALGSISKMRGPTPTQNPNYSPHLSCGRCWPCVPNLHQCTLTDSSVPTGQALVLGGHAQGSCELTTSWEYCLGSTPSRLLWPAKTGPMAFAWAPQLPRPGQRMCDYVAYFDWDF